MFQQIRMMLIGLLLPGLSGFSQSANLIAKIEGLKDSVVIIQYYYDQTAKTDTLPVQNGNFHWTRNLTDPNKAYITSRGGLFIELFVENSSMQIQGTLGKKPISITGSRTQDEYEAYIRTIQYLYDRIDTISGKFRNATEEEKSALGEKRDATITEIKGKTNAYVAAHPASAVSLGMILHRALVAGYAEVRELADHLDPVLFQTGQGRRLTTRLVILKRSSPGEQMPDFSLQDTAGNKSHLSAFRGKYVLVDFWASWCGPCRYNNKGLAQIYGWFHEKNFTILSISLDEDVKSWKKAIRQDQLTWPQSVDLKGFQSEAALWFGIEGVPCAILIDPQGKIVARDLMGQPLVDKILELCP